MLDLNDFYHLPEVDTLVEQALAGPAGLVAVAGLDARPFAPAPAEGGFLPSGRATVFGILARRMLARHAGRGTRRAVVVAESKDAVRLPRALVSRTRLEQVKPGQGYAAAARRRAGGRRPRC